MSSGNATKTSKGSYGRRSRAALLAIGLGVLVPVGFVCGGTAGTASAVALQKDIHKTFGRLTGKSLLFIDACDRKITRRDIDIAFKKLKHTKGGVFVFTAGH